MVGLRRWLAAVSEASLTSVQGAWFFLSRSLYSGARLRRRRRDGGSRRRGEDRHVERQEESLHDLFGRARGGERVRASAQREWQRGTAAGEGGTRPNHSCKRRRAVVTGRGLGRWAVGRCGRDQWGDGIGGLATMSVQRLRTGGSLRSRRAGGYPLQSAG